MAETEIKNPSWNVENQKQDSSEYTQKDLDDAVEVLWMLEEYIFDSDWKVGLDSNDTIIDIEYKKQIEKATDIKSKIEIVNSIYAYFSTEYYSTYEQKKSKYIDDEDKKNIDKIDSEIQKLLLKYPDYKKVFLWFIKHEFEIINWNVSFYEKAYSKTWDTETLKTIGIYSKEIYKYVLNFGVKNITEFIAYIESSNKITWKEAKVWVAESFIDSGNWAHWHKLDKVLNIDFYKNNREYYYWSSNDYECDNWDLIDLTTFDSEELDKVNNLYLEAINSNPKDYFSAAKLCDYIDKELSLDQKNILLSLWNIKNLYVEFKRGSLCIANREVVDWESLINMSNIKDKNISRIMESMLQKFYTTRDTNKQYEYVNNFVSNNLEELLSKADLSDKYYIVSFIKNFQHISSWSFKAEKGLNSFSNKIDQIYNREINKWLEEVNKIIKDLFNRNLNSEDLADLESKWIIKISKNPNTNEISYIPNKISYTPWDSMILWKEYKRTLEIIEKYRNTNYHSQSIRPKEPNEKLDSKPEPQISKEKKQEMQQKIDKLWLNATVNDNWKMVWKNWEETFKQKIQNWKVEVWVNDKLIYTTALWYKFELENNDIGNDKLLEITESFSYLDRIGLWYFWNNFQEMLESIRTYLPNQASYLNIDEQSWNFLSMRELNEIIIPIFKNVWFIDNSQNLDYLAPEEVTDTVMSHRLSKINWWKSFEKWKPFNKVIFWELLQQTNKV